MLIFKGLLKKYALGWLVDIYKKTTGYKTQIIIVLSIIVFIAETFAFIPKELAEQLYIALGSAGSITWLQKLKRYQEQLSKIAEEVKKEAEKPKS